MSESVKGVLAMVAACTVWGLSSIFYKLLDHISPIEILAHRTLWSLIFFAGVLALQGRLALLRAALGRNGSIVLIGVAALMISLNWFTFITSIHIGMAVEASLGYYIFPLVAVLLGAMAYRERLGLAQKWAVALAAFAVVMLTAGLGAAPWASLLIALSFGFYGLAKKHLTVGPVVSVTGEVLLLSPIALVVLGGVHSGPAGGAFGAAWGDSAMLALSGPLTATPLILFSYATRRINLGTVGLVQYLNPTLQFLVATLVFKEVFTFWHAVAFAMIWTALAIYSLAAWRYDSAARRIPPSS